MREGSIEREEEVREKKNMSSNLELNYMCSSPYSLEC